MLNRYPLTDFDIRDSAVVIVVPGLCRRHGFFRRAIRAAEVASTSLDIVNDGVAVFVVVPGAVGQNLPGSLRLNPKGTA